MERIRTRIIKMFNNRRFVFVGVTGVVGGVGVEGCVWVCGWGTWL